MSLTELTKSTALDMRTGVSPSITGLPKQKCGENSWRYIRPVDGEESRIHEVLCGRRTKVVVLSHVDCASAQVPLQAFGPMAQIGDFGRSGQPKNIDRDFASAFMSRLIVISDIVEVKHGKGVAHLDLFTAIQRISASGRQVATVFSTSSMIIFIDSRDLE
jgi:hypothetical protein